MPTFLAGHFTIGIEAILLAVQGLQVEQKVGGVLSNEKDITLVIHIDIVGAIGQAIGYGMKLSIIAPEFLVVFDPQPIGFVNIDVVGSSITSQGQGCQTVFPNALARVPIPEVYAAWSGGNDSAVMQLQDVQDTVTAESVGCVDRGKHELLCPTSDGTQQYDNI